MLEGNSEALEVWLGRTASIPLILSMDDNVICNCPKVPGSFPTWIHDGETILYLIQEIYLCKPVTVKLFKHLNPQKPMDENRPRCPTSALRVRIRLGHGM